MTLKQMLDDKDEKIKNLDSKLKATADQLRTDWREDIKEAKNEITTFEKVSKHFTYQQFTSIEMRLEASKLLSAFGLIDISKIIYSYISNLSFRIVNYNAGIEEKTITESGWMDYLIWLPLVSINYLKTLI